MKAMIFAAGLGTRLKPFTDQHPKALAPVSGKPALRRAIENVAAAGVNDIFINVHHFADQIIDFLAANRNFGMNIVVSDERELLLDTGGGLAKVARQHGTDEPLLVCNADIVTDLNLGDMVSAFDEQLPDALFLATRRESSRQLYFSEQGRLLGWQNLNDGTTRPEGFLPSPEMKQLAFGGIHIVGPKLLAALASESERSEVFPVMPFYLSHVDDCRIMAYTPENAFRWFDIGTPTKLAAADKSFGEK